MGKFVHKSTLQCKRGKLNLNKLVFSHRLSINPYFSTPSSLFSLLSRREATILTIVCRQPRSIKLNMTMKLRISDQWLGTQRTTPFEMKGRDFMSWSFPLNWGKTNMWATTKILFPLHFHHGGLWEQTSFEDRG